MLTSLDIANYFLSLKDYNDLTNLKIQKMIYYAYGLHLALYGDRLFGENIEAWDYGPVVPELYQALKQYKDQPIPLPQDFDLNIIGTKTAFLDEIYINYGTYSASDLCNLTHVVATPWHVVYNDHSTNCIINDYLLKTYFNELILLLKFNNNIDQMKAAKILSQDRALIETMYILSHPQNAQDLTEALESSLKGETVSFDWKNAN